MSVKQIKKEKKKRSEGDKERANLNSAIVSDGSSHINNKLRKPGRHGVERPAVVRCGGEESETPAADAGFHAAHNQPNKLPKSITALRSAATGKSTCMIIVKDSRNCLLILGTGD